MVLTDFGADTSAVQRLGDVKGPEDMVRTLRNIFEKFDADGNGFIDKAELVNILSFLGFPLDAVDVDRVYADMIGNVDAEAAGGNADGKVSIGEVATALGGELIDAQGTDHENSSIMTGAQELIVQAAVAEALPDN